MDIMKVLTGRCKNVKKSVSPNLNKPQYVFHIYIEERFIQPKRNTDTKPYT